MQWGANVDRTDIRYGRMMMEDVGGRADSKIAIPLRVEYWDGNSFVTNPDDRYSEFAGGVITVNKLSFSLIQQLKTVNPKQKVTVLFLLVKRALVSLLQFRILK